MIKISVIVPVYNVENYLRQCLDSIINQTLKDIEIICVDDCSPDNSIEILEEYKNKDNRISIIRHSNNQGLGPARNTGLKHANGEYISFIDSDDYIDKNFLFYLYSTAKKYDSDVTNTINIKNDFDGQLRDHWRFNKIKNLPNCFNDSISNISIKDEKENTVEYPYMTAWNKIYRKSFLLENDLYFMDIISGAEDEDFYKRLLICEPKMSYNHNAIYYYRQRQGSIMNIIQKDQIELLPNSINTISLMNNSINYCKIKNPDLLPYMYFKCFQLILSRFNKFSDNKLKSEFYNHIKEFSENTNLDEEITPKNIYDEYLKIKNSINFESYMMEKLTIEINRYKNEINKYKTEINKYKVEINKYKIINTRVNIADMLFSITYDNGYIFLRILGIKLTFKKNKK
ncbi:glycosyltransferase family 2 protein [Brachyspira innocens]|uniref:glycosyltransferase family 2 protein n=1 Tax=Brachyspira innocens TaxID=13264 RepID=UPI0026EBDC1F|nr:glycosyltransferase family 2 protein [Brachyspira innocens]